jgi:hypothetical protein
VEGGEKDILGEEERRGSDGVRARELERRGWLCARPKEKASFAGSVMPLMRTKARERYGTSIPETAHNRHAALFGYVVLPAWLTQYSESHKRSHLGSGNMHSMHGMVFRAT